MNNNLGTKKWLFLIVLHILLPFATLAQLTITEPDSTNIRAYKELVKKTLIGNGVLTGHFEVVAPASSIALFNFETDKNLVNNGLVLSTGSVKDIQGRNDTTNTSTEFFGVGDQDLSNLIGRLTADAVSIEFDFIPFSDSIGFYYFFASEEYPEYVGKGFNDAFAFLIKGPNYPYYTNIARIMVGPKIIPISIDNINFINNKDQFITNHLKADKKLLRPKSWQNELGEPEMLDEIEFDGMTKKLRAVAKVVPREVYRLKIVIADVGDMRYDSGVFLEKESFSSPVGVAAIDTTALLRKFIPYYKDEPKKLKELIREHPKIVEPMVEAPKTDTLKIEVYFKSDSFMLSFTERKRLENSLQKLDSQAQYFAEISGHTDSTAGFLYNQDLSQKRSTTVAKLLAKHQVFAKKVEAMGENAPKVPNKTPIGRQENRRVEILIYRE